MMRLNPQVQSVGGFHLIESKITNIAILVQVDLGSLYGLLEISRSC